jgi:hypothetical protein
MSKQISEVQFLEVFDDARPTEEQAIARKLIAWARKKGLKDDFQDRITTKGETVFIPILRTPAGEPKPFMVVLHHKGERREQAFLRVRLAKMKTMNPPPLTTEEQREVVQQLQTKPGLEMELTPDGSPQMPLSCLVHPQLYDHLIGTLDWIVNKIRGV